ncbi:MAG: 50S ribosomal protein L15 [bacterium]
MKLNELQPAPGARKKHKRVGCGPGSGHGKRSCRGNKGQKARNKVKIWFEGGQMPIQRRLPKRGFKNPTRQEYEVVNLNRLASKFSEGEEVTPEKLIAKRLVRKKSAKIKILGRGEISHALKISVHAISAKAREAVERCGGSVTLLK